MTLTATIGAPQTKVSVTDDETSKVIKFAWEKGDKVSVISLDKDGKCIANDIFTGTTAGKTANFTGTYTGGDAAKVMVYYPALSEKYEYEGVTCYQSPVESGALTITEKGVLYDLKVKEEFVQVRGSNYVQTALDSPSHLKNYMIMAGEADLTKIKSHTTAVTLSHNCMVLKLNLTFPEKDRGHLMRVSLSAFHEGGDIIRIGEAGWARLGENNGRAGGGSQIESQYIYLGGDTGVTISGTKATVYLVVPQGEAGYCDLVSGDKLTVGAVFANPSGEDVMSKDLTLSNPMKLEAGKVYTLNVEFPATDY